MIGSRLVAVESATTRPLPRNLHTHVHPTSKRNSDVRSRQKTAQTNLLHLYTSIRKPTDDRGARSDSPSFTGSQTIVCAYAFEPQPYSYDEATAVTDLFERHTSDSAFSTGRDYRRTVSSPNYCGSAPCLDNVSFLYLLEVGPCANRLRRYDDGMTTE